MMDDLKDKIVCIARRLSQHRSSSDLQGQIEDLYCELKEALAELDTVYPFECRLCNVRFRTESEYIDHQYSAIHIQRLNRPSPSSLCTG